MKRPFRFRLTLLIVVAVAAGSIVSEMLSRSFVFRDWLGRRAGRGRLVTIAHGKGIYETDLGEDNEIGPADLITREYLERAAKNEMVPAERVENAFGLLAAQFGDAKTFQRMLRRGGLTDSSLREKIVNQLRGLSWIEKQGMGIEVTEADCREFYEANPTLFILPVRYRAAHIFLAAHAETPPEVTAEKEAAIAGLAQRLQEGEALPEIATEVSEDEMTKWRGGDLGFFSETRMPVDFMTEIHKLQIGEVSKPFRTRLGFHVALLTDRKESRPLSFAEARPDISLFFTNQRRAARVNYLGQQLAGSAIFRSN